jgi:hypothetical protein
MGKGVFCTVNVPALVAKSHGVLTATVPVAAPGITIPTNVSPVLDTTTADTPPIVIDDSPFKSVPVIVTNVPGAPLAGVKEVTMGSGYAAPPSVMFQL